MIKNESQYEITKSQIAKFALVLGELSARSGAKSRLRQLEEDAIQSQLDELRNQVEQFDKLR